MAKPSETTDTTTPPAAPPPDAPPAPPAAPTASSDVATVLGVLHEEGMTGQALCAKADGHLAEPHATVTAAIGWGVNTGVGGSEATRIFRSIQPEDLAKLVAKGVAKRVSYATVGEFLRTEYPEPKKN